MQPASFPYFYNLPFDIRQLIWKYVFPNLGQTRLLTFKVTENNASPGDDCPKVCKLPPLAPATSTARIALSTCFDSRAFALRLLPHVLELSPQEHDDAGGLVRFNAHTDMVLIDWSRARCYYCNGSVLVPDYAMVAVDITHDSLASFRAEIRHLVIREKYMKMQSDGPTRRQMALNVSAMPSLNSVQLLTETNFSTLISPRYVCGHDYGDCQLYSNYLQEHTDCSHHFVRCGDEPSSPWSFRKYIDLLEQSLTLAISKSPDPPDYSDFQVCGYRDVNFGCLARLEISPPVAGDFFTPDSQWNVFDCPAGLVDYSSLYSHQLCAEDQLEPLASGDERIPAPRPGWLPTLPGWIVPSRPNAQRVLERCHNTRRLSTRLLGEIVTNQEQPEAATSARTDSYCIRRLPLLRPLKQ